MPTHPASLARAAMRWAALAAFVTSSTAGRADEPAVPDLTVDVALVLAVDASSSIHPAQARLQREGHAQALRSNAVNRAIAEGPVGCIAVTYVEWAGVGALRTVLPWTKLCNPADAAASAEDILRLGDTGTERRGRGRTSLSFAIEASSLLLDRFPGEATRKVVDISSNGTNNDGIPVTQSRDKAVGRGHVINAIVLSAVEVGVTDDLPGYFRQSVIGGPASFVIAPHGPDDYVAALRRKLVLEIAGLSDRAADAGTMRLAFHAGRSGQIAIGPEGGSWRN